MKKIKVAALSLVMVFALTTGAPALDPFSIRTALGSPRQVSGTISVTAGETLAFSARDLELRTGLKPGELQGLTLTALPADSQGQLVLDGQPVRLYQHLTRDEIDRLSFQPQSKLVNSVFTFIPQSRQAVTTSLSIQALAKDNLPPLVDGMSLSTMENVSARGYLDVYDPEGGTVKIQVVQRPARGEVTFDGQTFRYQPYQNIIGQDTFMVCAVDEAFNFSKEATISVNIERGGLGFAFVDMNGNPSAYAAIKLQQAGVLTGQKVGEQWFFHPQHQVTRGEFLVMLLAACGLNADLPPTVNTGLSNDSSIPNWLKPYIKRALELGIIARGEEFNPDLIPTRAEAVVLIGRAAGITDVKQYNLKIADLSSIPDWALQSYMDLAAYKMLDLYDGMARPAEALTNSYCADLIWQLYKHEQQ